MNTPELTLEELDACKRLFDLWILGMCPAVVEMERTLDKASRVIDRLLQHFTIGSGHNGRVRAELYQKSTVFVRELDSVLARYRENSSAVTCTPPIHTEESPKDLASQKAGDVFLSIQHLLPYIDGLEDGPHMVSMTKGWNFMVYGMEDPNAVTVHPAPPTPPVESHSDKVTCSECGSSLPFLKVEGGTKCQWCGTIWLWPDFGSSEDKELLDWMDGKVEIIQFSKPVSCAIRVWPESIRDALRTAKASMEAEKGGQES